MSKTHELSARKYSPKKEKKSYFNFNGNNRETSDVCEINDFTTISVCPTVREIRDCVEPILRPNKIIGHYYSVDQYLDIQFKLLREDLNRSMRRGINEYKQIIKSGKKQYKIRDIRVYEGIRIGKRCQKSLNAFWAQFNGQKLCYINWKFSKRLIYGSLLCLSSNNFETFCFASVAGDRNVENLSKGLFQLEFETESLTKEFKHIDPKTSFVMIESEVYFEAYKHTLLALKSLAKKPFPFKHYIIDLKTSILNPKYINGQTVYDFSTIIASNNTTKSNSNKSVKIMNSIQWPNAEQLDFDDSQYEAYKRALLSEFVLIQGPPGTGKTYVGLKIVQTLHHNRNELNKSPINQKPIVIICYTNHALDQFLEGMLPFCDNLIRIGGQSKSEILKDYTLKAIKEKDRSLCPSNLAKSIGICYNNMRGIHLEITKIDSEINNCRMDLLNLKELYELRPGNWFESQMKSLLNNFSAEFDLALIKWLTNFENKSNGFRNLVPNLNENSISNHLYQKRVEMEFDEQEVNRIIETRLTDFDFYENILFNEANAKVFNTIFKTNSKSLKRISKRVVNQLKSEMSFQLTSNDVMNFDKAVNIRDVTQMSYTDRWRLYRLWVKVYIDLKNKVFNYMNEEFDKKVETLKGLHLEKDMYLIGNRAIVGMTTTGAAKFRNLMEAIDPKIIVIEEAAEVLESHVITSLTANTEHLILIGDHQQLRPIPAVYELTHDYNLDVSLFERMIKNRMPFIQLKLQHRMRPEISKLLVPHIYRQLKDHESVKHYEDIRGVKRNMFFINHSNNESSNDERMSKSNEFEAKFIVRLCKHFLYQDYNSSQITILTLYSSQLILIRQLLKLDPIFDGIEANSVDNFQGEENDIILLSFVRSNHNNETGFLKVPNRVNVALSRAKKGLYCVGNFDCLSKKSKLWTEITNYLKKGNAIGPELELKCANHSEKVIKVSNVKDFESKSPFGGCCQPYRHTLECGHNCLQNICHISHRRIKCSELCLKANLLKCEHNCLSICHFPEECEDCVIPIDKIVPKCGHKIKEICSGSMFCYNPCEQTLDCGHKCDKKCGEECQTQCVVKVEKTIEECGHSISVECSKSPICYMRCGKLLLCGHECQLKCSETCDSNRCLHSVSKIFIDCGHEVQTQCYKNLNELICKKEVILPLNCGHDYKLFCNWMKTFVNSSQYCTEKCDHLLVCGHRCEGSCVKCNQSRLHRNCQQKCERKLICGHDCSGICGQNCPPCDQICANSCPHNKCFHTCSEPCIQCSKSRNWKCKHKKFSKKCSQFRDSDVCQMSCDKKLSCGHRCIGVCGEKCLKFCLDCHKSRIHELYGIEGMSESQINSNSLKFIELENCEHIIEFNALKSLLTNIIPNVIFKSCPKCQTLITKCQIFNNLIQKQFSKLIELNRNYFCLNAMNESKQKNLTKSIDCLRNHLNPSLRYIIRENIKYLLNQLKGETSLRRKLYIKSEFQLSVIENKVNVIKLLLTAINEMIKQSNGRQMNRCLNSTQIQEYFKRMETFVDFICGEYQNTWQQICDTEQELRFFVIFAKLSKHLKSSSIGKQSLEELVKAFDTVLNTGVFTEDNENAFVSKVFGIIGTNNEFNCSEVKLIARSMFNVLL